MIADGNALPRELMMLERFLGLVSRVSNHPLVCFLRLPLEFWKLCVWLAGNGVGAAQLYHEFMAEVMDRVDPRY